MQDKRAACKSSSLKGSVAELELYSSVQQPTGLGEDFGRQRSFFSVTKLLVVRHRIGQVREQTLGLYIYPPV
jgi:hypothetical protein